MLITLCGSLAFFAEMQNLESLLIARGHRCALPVKIAGTDYSLKEPAVGIANIRQYDLIRRHYREIQAADAILVVNEDRKGIPHYIGGNTFLEMGFAYVLGKRIYVLHPLPLEVNYYEEMAGMDPVILQGDLSLIR